MFPLMNVLWALVRGAFFGRRTGVAANPRWCFQAADATDVEQTYLGEPSASQFNTGAISAGQIVTRKSTPPEMAMGLQTKYRDEAAPAVRRQRLLTPVQEDSRQHEQL